MISVYNNYIIINLQMDNLNNDNVIDNITDNIIDVNNISEQKEEENILDINNDTLLTTQEESHISDTSLTIFDKCAFDISCIYLIILGYTINLRSSFRIDEKYNNNTMIMKYGCTKNLKIRFKQHFNTFKNINGVNLKIQKISLIDQSDIFKAEAIVKDITLSYKFIFKKFDELLIVNNKELKFIEDQYNIIGELYNLSKKRLIDKYEKDLLIEQHKTELIQRDKQLLIEQHKTELIQRDKQLLIERHNIELERREKESLIALRNADLERYKHEIDMLQRISTLEKQNLEQQIAYLTEKLNNLSK